MEKPARVGGLAFPMFSHSDIFPLRDCIPPPACYQGVFIGSRAILPPMQANSQDLHIYEYSTWLHLFPLILCKNKWLYVLWFMTTLFYKQWNCQVHCFLLMGRTRKDPHLPHGGNGKWPPSLRTSQDSRTSPPRTAKPKIIPPNIGYFKRFNKSRQRHSDNRTSWTSVTSTSSQRQALLLQLRDTFSQLVVATR